MNVFLWVLPALAAYLSGASGCTKVFMFDRVSEPMILSGVRGLLVAFVAYGRMVPQPIS
jgi:hypothetical protein